MRDGVNQTPTNARRRHDTGIGQLLPSAPRRASGGNSPGCFRAGKHKIGIRTDPALNHEAQGSRLMAQVYEHTGRLRPNYAR